MDELEDRSLRGRGAFALLILLGLLALTYVFREPAAELLRESLTYSAWGVLVLGGLGSVLVSLLVLLGLALTDLARVIAARRTKKLALAHEQFHVLYESSPVPYLIVTPEGTITNPNKAACELFRLPAEALEGMDLFASLADASGDAIGLQERLTHSLSAKRQEARLAIAERDTRYVLFSMHEVKTAGRFSHMGLVTLVDITEQKEIERKKTEFLSLASHQLRTPLSRIRWFADMLRETELTEKQRGYIDRLYRGNLLMIETVNTLLNMTRMELGTLEVEKEPYDLTEQLRGVEADYERSLTEGSLTLEAQMPPSAPIVSDQKLVRVVLDNLLTNATRYTPEGGRITVSLAEEEDRWKLTVADTGCGIPEDAKPKIFTKQFRAANAKAISNDGTGLGMYMTHQLVEMLGGSISFTSREGEGTTFSVLLPKE